MKRVLAIHLANWPLQRLTATRPELFGQAVILHHPTRRSVEACSDEARRAGVDEQMPVAEAAALLQRQRRRPANSSTPNSSTPNSSTVTTHIEPHDPQEDLTALKKLAQWCHRYCPNAGVEDAAAPTTLLLDITGVAPLWGGEVRLVEQVERGLQRLRLFPQIGVADTVGLAWAAAHHLAAARDALPPLAEQAVAAPTTQPQPTWVVIDSRWGREVLLSLPLAALRLPLDTVATLQRLGLECIGDLWLLPRVELQVRFGPQLLQRMDQALGEAGEVIETVPQPEEFVAEWLFDYPVQQRSSLEEVVKQLLGRLALRLSAGGEGALQLRCRFDCAPDPVEMETGLYRPTANAQHLFEIMEMQMERLQLPGAVQGVVMKVTSRARLEWRQQGLFEQAQRRDDSPQIALLVDRLTSRLGRAGVAAPALRNDAQPELAYRLEPCVDRSRRANTRSLTPLDRPLQLLRPPVRLQIAAATDGAPAQFHYDGRVLQVARHWGPERIETGWWRRRGVQRDYYRIETITGQRFWLFRQLRSGEWFLHGLF